ncbi:acyltransferase family protein [Sphingomonas sp.]|uniref:acyltransferase family protein n=1 Tax=Sphingomonas sp. TaxID=28214 RepID=UPI0025E729AD|nr:acyltransferase family protein [Sphingomonas sp.]
MRADETPQPPLHPVIRTDIQLLRALAIILVILHHARFPYLPAGFLGVDIFFVISGFLMTGLIDKALAEGRFTFASFYARRVRRLLPAAYATLIGTAILAPLLIDAAEYRGFVGQLAGSFTFVVNMVLWQQSGYFANAATLKPLLHMWSLSVEEQFYIVLPPLMLLCPARFRLALAAVLVMASAALCFMLVDISPSVTFYFLPTRAWELGMGAVIALALRGGVIVPAPLRATRLLCCGLLAIVPFVSGEGGHPGLPALLVCFATAVLMIPTGNRPFFNAWLKPLTLIGDRSYSLYLVHWPIFAFANQIFIRPVPAYVNALLLILCFIVAEAQYQFVEQRFRKLAINPRSIALLVLVPIIVVGSSFALSRANALPDTLARSPNTGLSPVCEYFHGFTAERICQTQDDPETMVWGDSFGMALTPGLAATLPQGLVQATRSVCGPFLGISPINDANFSRGRAETCLDFNNQVLDYLSRHPEIRTVVLTSALIQYSAGGDNKHWTVLVQTPAGPVAREQSIGDVVQGLSHTVSAIRALGRKVVMFAPPPSIDFDTGRCLMRAEAGLFTIGASGDCRFTRSAYEAYRKPNLDLLAAFRARNLVPIITLDQPLCGSGECLTRLDGTMLYADDAHLSSPGSRLLGTRMNWGAMVARTAR